MDATSNPENRPNIVVLGLRGGWQASVAEQATAVLAQTDVLVGGKRQLGQIDAQMFAGERVPITSKMDVLLSVIADWRAKGKRVTVLASGDPLCFGIGATLLRTFPPDVLDIRPDLSAFQLAFARLSEPWHDAKLVSAHGRLVQPVVSAVMTHAKTAVLTDGKNTPDVIGRLLLDAGLAQDSKCAVCERLGAEDERVVRLTLGEMAERSFDPLNVLIVWNEVPVRPKSPGIPDSMFATHKGQITKREVRLAVLGEIGLLPDEVLWDVGSGSGSVAIEAARMVPTAMVIGLERAAAQVAAWRKNQATFGAFNARLVVGDAPDGLDGLVRPNAVFIGGSGGRLKEIIEIARERLVDDGRIVAAFATFESLTLAREVLPDAMVYQVGVSRVKAVGSLSRLDALNPVFVLKWVKSDGSQRRKGAKTQSEEVAPRSQEAAASLNELLHNSKKEPS